MKSFILFTVVVIYIFFSSTSCKRKESPPCPVPDTVYNSLNNSEVGKIPYTGFDTLKFKNEATGMVHTFIGQRIDTSLTNYQVWHPDMCPEKFQKCQSKKYKFISNTLKHPIILQAYWPYGDEGVNDLEVTFDGVYYHRSLSALVLVGYTDTINGVIYSGINDLRNYDNNTFYRHIKYNFKEGILQVVNENKIYSRQN